jgi:hypothetical protein
MRETVQWSSGSLHGGAPLSLSTSLHNQQGSWVCVSKHAAWRGGSTGDSPRVRVLSGKHENIGMAANRRQNA